jgi:hypothetical protein
VMRDSKPRTCGNTRKVGFLVIDNLCSVLARFRGATRAE